MIVRRLRRVGALDPLGWASARPARSHRLRGLASVLLALPLVLGLIGLPANAPEVRGDQLSDARAQQAQLKKQAADQAAAIAQLQALQAGLATEIAQTRIQLNGVNADLQAVKTRIGRMTTRIYAVKYAYAGLIVQLSDLDEHLAQITAQEQQKQVELQARRELLADHLRAAYDTNRTSLLESFLSGGTFTDLLTQMSYTIDIGEQDKALAEQIVRDQAVLAALHQNVLDTRTQTETLRVATDTQRAALASSLHDLKVAKAQLAKLQAQVTRDLQHQNAAYATILRNKHDAAKALAAAAAAERKLTSRINQLIKEQTSRANIPSIYNGTLEWPMSGVVTQEFGCTGVPSEPPLGSCAHFHQGIDIAAPMYTPVRAAGDGTVVFAGPNPYDPYPKAWIVIIAHSTQLTTWYAHLDNGAHGIPVTAGQTVHAGDIVGYEGMTGRTTGPHLHWAVQLNDTFVNPRLFL